MNYIGNSVNFKSNLLCRVVNIEIFNTINIALTCAIGSDSISTNSLNSSDRPLSFVRLFIPSYKFTVKLSGSISKSDSTTLTTSFTRSGRLINRKTTRLNRQTKTHSNFIKIKKRVSNSYSKIAVIKIFSEKGVSSSSTDFRIGNTMIKSVLSIGSTNTYKVLTLENKNLTNTRKKRIFLHAFPPILNII